MDWFIKRVIVLIEVLKFLKQNLREPKEKDKSTILGEFNHYLATNEQLDQNLVWNRTFNTIHQIDFIAT
jgi:hypothetical protein